jgi:hypothetical protein
MSPVHRPELPRAAIMDCDFGSHREQGLINGIPMIGPVLRTTS